MIVNGRNLFYNLNGIFWSNSIESNNLANAQISALEWNERFVITNPHADDEQQIHRQLELIADNIVTLIINRTSIS
jgi:hypothetical protein